VNKSFAWLWSQSLYVYFSMQRMKDEWSDSASTSIRTHTPIKVVTFDLDNTLWNTSAVIGDANSVLALHLDACGVRCTKRVEVMMGSLFKLDSENKYSPPGAKSPVFLTRLRTDAIIEICVKENGYEIEKARTFAEEAFGIWDDGRHEAIIENLAEGVLDTLREVRQISSEDGSKVIVGAITDGNSDPRKVPCLREFFDFCVNAEAVGVSKPDRKVYAEAVSVAETMHAFKECTDDKYAGPYWVHIGDDFLKDVVAAKEMKMRSIWSRELVAGQNIEEKKLENGTVEDLIKKLASGKNEDMIIGGDDFLANALVTDFADATVHRLRDIISVLNGWHQMPSANQDEAEPQIVQKQVEDIDVSEENSLLPFISNEASTKFCIFCGTKIPGIAKFCSSCGESV